MNELFLFVRPPRPQWPFNGSQSAVWPPLAFASLAAALREKVRGLRVAILDAPALRMGWRSLEAELRRLQPAFVAMGEEAVSCQEGLRLARIARQLQARVIAGGCFFGHVSEEAIATGLVDVVVHGEGEVTIVELMDALRSGSAADLRRVQGITFIHGEEIVHTNPRPLITDLDQLPMPAYDLLPMQCYGRRSRNHPDLAAIELGRGCFGSCNFCVLWRQMGRFQGSTLVPHLRTKSPERLIEEIRILVKLHHRRYLGWVDPCFNASPNTTGRLADQMLRQNLRIGQSAWVRADALLRDADSGELERLVRSGLNEVYVGIERGDALTLDRLNKSVEAEECRRALKMLAQDFPEVYTVGSFIYGMPGDTPESVKELRRYASELDLDYAFFIPLTPLPGTPYWKREMWDPSGEKFRRFGFLPGPPIHGNGADLERALLSFYLFDWNYARIRGWWRGVIHRDARKRRLTRRLLFRGCAFEARLFFRSILGENRESGMVFPRWYES
jgi:anaerobic magnesium-protoporphyrin IX monomethyl ester cyclase